MQNMTCIRSQRARYPGAVRNDPEELMRLVQEVEILGVWRLPWRPDALRAWRVHHGVGFLEVQETPLVAACHEVRAAKQVQLAVHHHRTTTALRSSLRSWITEPLKGE